jgi:hypothetical protein
VGIVTEARYLERLYDDRVNPARDVTHLLPPFVSRSLSGTMRNRGSIQRTSQSTAEPHRVTINATLDAQLVEAIDGFVKEHPDLDRDAVIEDALRLWYAREQDKAMEARFAAPHSTTEEEEHAAWRRIQTAAAERIFRRR